MTRGRAAVVLVLIALGLANTIALYGWDPLVPTNIDWITGDPATHYAAWAAYRHDTHVHFPLGWTDRIGYPIGASIAWQEPITLAAVLLRPFGPVLPEPFQYLGWYAALCFVLQAYFGYQLCDVLFPGRRTFNVLGGVFFLIAAPLTWRALGHIPFLSQWLILASLAAYLRDPGERPIRWLIGQWIVLAFAAAITSYIAVMCFLIALTAVARLRLEGRCNWTRTLTYTGITVVILLGTAATFGVIASAQADSYWAPGYGRFSMNLDAPLNPLLHGSLLPVLPLAFDEQYEGYNYLGVGLVALLAVGMIRRTQLFKRLTEPRFIPLLALAVVCTALAVSTTVTLGPATLVQIPLPPRLFLVVEGLRASGRFFWPVYYLIVSAALALTFSAWTPRVRIVVLSLAIALQFFDLMPLRARVRADLERRYPNPLVSDAWKGLGRRYENLILVPPYQCNPNVTPGGVDGYVAFGKLAGTERMRSNSYYAGRYSHAQLQAHCVDLLRAALIGPLNPRSAYVVTDAARIVWELDGVTAHCRVADGFNLCTADGAEPPSRVSDAAPYSPGERLDFLTGGNAARFVAFGVTPPTPIGSWTQGPIALLRLGIRTPLEPGRALVLDVESMPLVTARHPHLTVDVFVNQEPLATWTFDAPGGFLQRRARILSGVANRRPEIDLEFRVRNPEAPLYVGTDASILFEGLCLRKLRVDYE